MKKLCYTRQFKHCSDLTPIPSYLRVRNEHDETDPSKITGWWFIISGVHFKIILDYDYCVIIQKQLTLQYTKRSSVATLFQRNYIVEQ